MCVRSMPRVRMVLPRSGLSQSLRPLVPLDHCRSPAGSPVSRPMVCWSAGLLVCWSAGLLILLTLLSRLGCRLCPHGDREFCPGRRWPATYSRVGGVVGIETDRDRLDGADRASRDAVTGLFPWADRDRAGDLISCHLEPRGRDRRKESGPCGCGGPVSGSGRVPLTAVHYHR